MDSDGQNQNKVSLEVAGVIVVALILSHLGSTILTPLWTNALNITSPFNMSWQPEYIPITDHHVDPFSMLLIINVLFTAVFGVIYLIIKHPGSTVITEYETSYGKKEFAIVGITDTIANLMFVLGSSNCRTESYLQSMAANFSIPVTFFLRLLILRKLPTFRKVSCAFLVLVAAMTVFIPDIAPGLESSTPEKNNEGPSGMAKILWPICYITGIVPLAISSIVVEKIMKSKDPSSEGLENSKGINTAYMLFWCYFFSLVTQVVLFWIDIIPGFGLTKDMTDFAKLVWFNIKCFFGFEGCQGSISCVSVSCVVLVSMNRIMQAYFVRYLEGANLMAIMLTIPTTLALLFYSLFDEKPLKWHPHADLTTWLSIVALCIMIPAIYIYITGPSERDLNKRNNHADDTEERRPLLGGQFAYDNNNASFNGSVMPTESGGFAATANQTASQTEEVRGQQAYSFQPTQQPLVTQETRPSVGEHSVHSDAFGPSQVERRDSTSQPVIQIHTSEPVQTGFSSTWNALENTRSDSQLRDCELFGDGRVDNGCPNETPTEQQEGNQSQNSFFENKRSYFFTVPDHNDSHQTKTSSGNQSNTLGTSPLVDCDTRTQTAMIYNGYIEPAEIRNQEDGLSMSEAGHQFPDGVSSTPSSNTMTSEC